MHLIHKKCIWKTGKNICPLCRVEVELPKKQLQLMEIRAKRFEKERIEEEHQILIAQELEIENIFNERLNNLYDEELINEIIFIAHHFDITFTLENINNL